MHTCITLIFRLQAVHADGARGQQMKLKGFYAIWWATGETGNCSKQSLHCTQSTGNKQQLSLLSLTILTLIYEVLILECLCLQFQNFVQRPTPGSKIFSCSLLIHNVTRVHWSYDVASLVSWSTLCSYLNIWALNEELKACAFIIDKAWTSELK